MFPEARAAADALIWQGALLRHLVSFLPPGAAGASCPGPGWSVSQTLHHLADDQARQAATFRAHVEGQPPAAPRTLATPEDGGLEAALEALAAGRNELYGLLARLSPSRLHLDVVPGLSLRDALARFPTHYATHAFDILEAVPGLATDPLIFTWLIHGDYSRDPEGQARQRRAVRLVRERLATAEGQE